MYSPEEVSTNAPSPNAPPMLIRSGGVSGVSGAALSPPTNLPTASGSGLARALVQHGLLEARDLEALYAECASSQTALTEQLVISRRISALALAEFAAKTFSAPFFDLAAFNPLSVRSEWVDLKLMMAQRAIPLFARGNRLFVAVTDPTDLHGLEALRFMTHLVTEPVVVEEDKLAKTLIKVAEQNDHTLRNLASEGEIAANTLSAVVDDDVEDAPIVRYVQKIMVDAINSGVSDIHFEPYEKYYRIRYRQDGALVEIGQPPIALKEKIASRIKVISRLDISEKRLPQDGRVKLKLSATRAIDFRVSTLPTLHGEKIVMRILDSSNALVGIDSLGMDEHQKALVLEAIKRPHGMVLTTGPTGSGKTISLYTFLSLLNKPGINISSAEDPAEIMMHGINQVNIHEKSGLTFASALRSFLRQDPDVIMVGEIRDLETADICIKAAQTGHMVLSTLHTNDAPSTLVRLLNMGVAPFNVASSVALIIAQRLARRLCADCKVIDDVHEEALKLVGFSDADLNGTWRPYRAVGCEHCRETGYKGRVGIFEVMPVTEPIQRLIQMNASTLDLRAKAQLEGVKSLRESALQKVRMGITSIEEIAAVTNA